MLVGFRWAIERAAEWRATCKFGHVFLGVVATLIQRGFCGKNEDDGNAGDGELDWDDDVEGTGMGEGQGKNDVSKQIEDPEEQLMGTNNERKEEGGDEREEDDAIDMELDFEGNLHDMDSGEEDQGDDADRENEDREMGDEKQDDVVDEKMWDGPSDEEDQGEREGEDAGRDTFEKDNPLKMQEGMELEMGAKQDEDEDAAAAEENNKEKDSDNDKEDEEDKGEGDMPEQENEGSERPPQQPDEVVDNQGTVQDADDFELPPDEMEVSDGDEGEENNDEGGKEENEAMEISGDEEDVEGGEEEDKAPEDEQEDMNNAEKERDEEEEASEAEAEGAAGEPMDEDENQDDQQGERGGEKSQDRPENADEDKEAAQYGVRERGAGAVELHGAGDASQAEADDSERPKDSGPGDADTHGAAGGGDEGDGGEGATQHGHGSQASREKRPPAGPNPLRQLGDALRQFHRKVEAEESNGKQEDNSTKLPPPIEGTNDRPSPSRAEFDDQGQEQALGAATDEQLREQDRIGPEGLEEQDDAEAQQVLDDEEDEDKDATSASVAAAEKSDSVIPERREADVPDPSAGAPAKEAEEAESGDAAGRGGDEARANRGFGALEEMEEDSEVADGEKEGVAGDDSGVVEPEELRADMEALLAALGPNERAEGERMWRDCATLTRGPAAELAEQLRLLLLPSRATSLEGDYRTGKRINMKRVIPYIASDFKKDKIWLRRKKPTKRNYQIMVAIDDSRSMRDHRKGQMALEALATITTALTTLEAGQLAVAKFGDRTRLLHGFDGTWSDARGAEVCGAFSFGEAETNVHGLLETILGLMREQRLQSSGREEEQQLAFIISDGLLTSRGAALTRLVSQAAEEGVMLVFVLIDNQGEGSGSVLDIQSIVQHKGKMARKAYMDSFPFPFYVVLQNLVSLPMVLADALRQWIELMDRK